MKNKNKKCCVVSKMSGTNIFVGILIGLVVLIFGGKIFLSQTPVPQARVINGTLIDKALSKKTNDIKKIEVVGTWNSDAGELILNEDGTVVSDLDITGWSIDGDVFSMTFKEGSNYTVNLADNTLTLTSDETVIVYNK
jgi:hypothetical protein